MPYKRKDSPYYWISYTDAAGRRISRSSGYSDYREAKAEENQLRADSHRKRSPYAAKTFDDVMEAYLTNRPTERAAYAVKALLPHFTGKSIQTVTAADIAAYKASRGVSDSTLAKELGTFRAAIRFCNREYDWGLPDPTQGRIPKEPHHRMRWLTNREACKLVTVAQHEPQAPYLADLIMVALHTGLRRGELLGLEWSRVDLRSRVIHLAPEHQKGKKHSTVPLNAPARDALLRRAGYRATICPDSAWVFTRKGSRIGSIKKSFATCGAWMVQAGVPLRTVADILRHSSISTTMKYAHLSPDNARAGVEALERSDLRSADSQNASHVVHRSHRFDK
jgi:integrase